MTHIENQDNQGLSSKNSLDREKDGEEGRHHPMFQQIKLQM